MMCGGCWCGVSLASRRCVLQEYLKRHTLEYANRHTHEYLNMHTHECSNRHTHKYLNRVRIPGVVGLVVLEGLLGA